MTTQPLSALTMLLSRHTKRREFIPLLGVAAAWPLGARAQERMRRVGVLMNTTSDEPDSQARVTALAQGLQEAGWAVGRNLRVDTRWGAGDAERNRKYDSLTSVRRIAPTR